MQFKLFCVLFLSVVLVVAADLGAGDAKLKKVSGLMVVGNNTLEGKRAPLSFCYDLLTTCSNVGGFTTSQLNTLVGLIQGNSNFETLWEALPGNIASGDWTLAFSSTGWVWYTYYGLAASCSCSAGEIIVALQ